MTATVTYTVETVNGLQPSERRGLAFLLSNNPNDDLNAHEVFNDLSEKASQTVRSRFDWWMSGSPPHDQWFHGFPNSDAYCNCFVFKWKERREHHRLYGFLCHPRPTTNARFQVCVLASHATKNEWETDLAELNSANAWRINPAVTAAVTMAYTDGTEAGNRWPN